MERRDIISVLSLIIGLLTLFGINLNGYLSLNLAILLGSTLVFSIIIYSRSSSISFFLSKGDIFRIYPIQKQGENIYYYTDEGKHRDDFFVKVHFKLWSKFEVRVININLSYDVKSCAEGGQKISINEDGNTYEKIDQTYRMMRPKPLKSGVNDIFVSRDFRGEPGRGGSDDFKCVRISIELSSECWKGIKYLIIEGKLGGLGRWNLSRITFDSKKQKIEPDVL